MRNLIKRFVFLLLLFFAPILVACDGGGGGGNSDLPKEMAAKTNISQIKLLMGQKKIKEAKKLMIETKLLYGHTKTFTEAEGTLATMGLSGDIATQNTSLAAKALIDLQNQLLTYFRSNGRWPGTGEVKRPVDPWGNEPYWIVGTPKVSYDLLIVSSGPDGVEGSGDEPMIVWTQEDVGGYKDKKTGKLVGKQKKDRKALKPKKVTKGHTSEVMTLDDLKKMDKEAGYKDSETADIDLLKNMAPEKSRNSNDGEVTMSIEELSKQL